MHIKLMTNEHSQQTNKIPFYADWEAVVASNFGDTQTDFFDLSMVDCILIMGKDGKSLDDYFVLVQPANINIEQETGEEILMPHGQQIWVRHLFLYDSLGNNLDI